MASLVTKETSQKLGFNMQRLSGSRLTGVNLRTMANADVAPSMEESPIPFDIEDLKELQDLQSNQTITMPKKLGDFKIINKQ